MIRALFWTDLAATPKFIRPENIPAARAGRGLLWVDLFEENDGGDEEFIPLLEDIFNFHPLAISDALKESHLPRVDDWGSYIYLVLNTPPLILSGLMDDPRELDLFLGKDFLVTYHNRAIIPLEKVWDQVQAGVHPYEDEPSGGLLVTPGWLVYLLSDEIANGFMAITDLLEAQIDLVEDKVFSPQERGTLEEIADMKKAALHLHRMVTPQRELFNRLARTGINQFTNEDRLYFRDITDHYTRLAELNSGLRDLANGVMETYLSFVNNRMNDIMRLLTIITTLFMPLSFLTGFFGMNFFEARGGFDPWTGDIMFLLVMAIMLGSPLGMVLWMRKRGWV